MEKNNRFKSAIFPIADFTVKINTNAQSLMNYLSTHYINKIVYFTSTNIPLVFDIDEDESGVYFLRCRQIKFNIKINNQVEDQKNWCVIETIKILSQYYFIDKGVIFLHGSAIVHHKKTYVFCGFAGTGKSTISNKVIEADKMADDQVIIKKCKKKYYVFSSIFDLKLKKPNFNGVLLGKIFSIIQATSLVVKPIRKTDKILTFLMNGDLFNAVFEFYLNHNKGDNRLHLAIAKKIYKVSFKEKQLRLYLDLCSQLRFSHLFFNKQITRNQLFRVIADSVAK